MSKYQALYQRYRRLIHEGTYKGGERLPSLRRLARDGGHGINTVRSAVELLEREGLVRIHRRGGVYVKRRQLLPPAKAPEESLFTLSPENGRRLDLVMERLALGNAGYAVASPGEDLLPAKALQRLYTDLPPSWITYADPAGDEDLRRRIALHYEQVNGPCRSQDLVVTNGATEALHLLMLRFIRPGDTVVVESPAYFDFFRQLSAAQANLVEVPVRPGAGMDLDLLELELKRRPVRMILCQPNVQNPTGTSMDDSGKKRLLSLAQDHGCLLVQDDVYGDLYYSPARPRNLPSFGNYENLILVSSLSKSLAPGMRIGWILSPTHAEDLTDVKLRVSCATNRPAQAVIAAFLASPAFPKHLQVLRTELAQRAQEYADLLAEHLPVGSQISQANGGCLLWIALPPRVDGSQVFLKAAREGVLAAPGELFSANPYFKSFLRINAGRKLIPPRRNDLLRLCKIAQQEAGG